jgi:hypothetical protein
VQQYANIDLVSLSGIRKKYIYLFFAFSGSCRNASENRCHHLMRMKEATGAAREAATIAAAVVETQAEAVNPELIIILAAMTTPMMTTPTPPLLTLRQLQ